MLETVIIDEAQDLSRLQWDLVLELAERCNVVYVAGDDDQGIFSFAGARVENFLNLPGNIKVLEQSYRVPAKVHRLANSVVRRIRIRQEKSWNPRDTEGEVSYYNDFEQVDVSEGEWLIMAAANYMLNDMYAWLKSQGVLFERNGQKSISDAILTAVLGWEALRKGKDVPFPVVKQIYKYLGSGYIKRGFKTLTGADPEALYTMDTLREKHGLDTDGIWHVALSKIGEDKRDYLIALLRRGTRVAGNVRVKLSTIHGAKGGEADNVLLLTDLSTKFAREYDRNADDIHRLFYVGLTRARETLHIVLPKNEQKGFRL
jgi:DNA helicase-2/ATP-dependent DNA helicase PcrA